MHPLSWILRGHAKFKPFLTFINEDAPSLLELHQGVWIALALIVLRVTYNRSLLSTAERCAAGPAAENRKRAYKLLEEVWVTAGGVVLAIWAWAAAAHGGPTCNLWHLGECLRGWPLLKVPQAMMTYYNAELGWYIHLLLKHVMGYGAQDGSDMRLHHVATLALLLLSVTYNGMHVGTYVLALLNLSNPVLHLAKIANDQGWPAARKIAFPCFALVFFVSRVVIYPVTVLHFGWYQAKEVLPEVRSELRGPYIVFNALLLLLYLLQLQWMYGIVRLLARALSRDFETFGKLADVIDPTSKQAHAKHK